MVKTRPQSNKLTYNHSANTKGMLAVYLACNKPDLTHSRSVIKRFRGYFSGFDRAFDLAGGVGRVTKSILKPNFRHVDI